MRRLLCLLLILTMLPAAAISSGLDYAGMTDEQLLAAEKALCDVMIERGLCAYISISGKKYHSKPTCSGMTQTLSVSVTDLNACGYEPCKKCYRRENK